MQLEKVSPKKLEITSSPPGLSPHATALVERIWCGDSLQLQEGELTRGLGLTGHLP